MSFGVNKVTLLGYVGKDPDIRYLQNGTCVAKISLATSDSWKDKKTGEKVEHTEWHNCTIFGKLGEICGEYVKKGEKLYLEGSIRTSKYIDKETKQERQSKEIIVSQRDGKLQIVSAKKDDDKKEESQKITTTAESTIDFDQDIPF